ncbi:sulfurtransferase complex subunit TusC [Motilimonas eburnea]|uniref:sulfurtransferase complex subunit TusC n=1 Tax=Motilimonas eburnea TaxID=1737488 RepID=UPI001E535895|nr:sulfurtransferase complex subunit TusC [Motilimonas eburnea]MCE2572316.1 sulfurtransferase complex subunit TusC [Motilimonas eburnea]
MKLAILNTQAPHGNANARESLDAVLALSAFTEQLTVLFSGDGVYQLQPNQQPQAIMQRHIEPMFKLLDLYDVESVFVSLEDCQQRHLDPTQLAIPVTALSASDFNQVLQQQQYLIKF